MIKEKLMKALKVAADDYNGGMNANAAVAKAAEAADFNEKQAERLTEVFNTTMALTKQADKADPTGACELADKATVAKLLLDGAGIRKSASSIYRDYSFYASVPIKTNPTMEARSSGRSSMCKAASSDGEQVPAELNVSQRSLYKIIEGKIDLLKSASAAADDVVRNLKLDVEDKAIKIAKVIEAPFADAELADMFKTACEHKAIVDLVSEYSTKVAESTGGRFSYISVFDTSKVDDLLKMASEANDSLSVVGEYESKRDLYMSKAAEAQDEMRAAVGITPKEVSASTLADMFQGIAKKAEPAEPKSGSSGISKLLEGIEKESAAGFLVNAPISSVSDSHSALVNFPGIDYEEKRLMNVRREILLAKLMSEDPIIRDADPEIVANAYKTMIMTSPRVSLDEDLARAFLRTAVNSVAISPSDAKTLTDVDKGISVANVDKLNKLSILDSSVKDSNA